MPQKPEKKTCETRGEAGKKKKHLRLERGPSVAGEGVGILAFDGKSAWSVHRACLAQPTPVRSIYIENCFHRKTSLLTYVPVNAAPIVI